MRISDWSSDVCSSDLIAAMDKPALGDREGLRRVHREHGRERGFGAEALARGVDRAQRRGGVDHHADLVAALQPGRSEEHTSELQSLMRISYAVLCLKKKTQSKHYNITNPYCQDQA